MAGTQNAIQSLPARAFTKIDLLVTVALLLVLVVVLMPTFARVRERRTSVTCVNNLKQLGLLVRTWSADHNGAFPFPADISAADVFHSLLAVSNGSWGWNRIMICPADTRPGATNLGPEFANINISYFLADTDETQPQSLLAGDRNITNGTPLVNGFLLLSTNSRAGWTHELHHGFGNVLLSDSSVQGANSAMLGSGANGEQTNRLAMP
jgi:hypothetical protein